MRLFLLLGLSIAGFAAKLQLDNLIVGYGEVICFEDDVELTLSGDTVIEGSICCKGSLTVVSEHGLELASEGEIISSDVVLKTIDAPHLHGKIVADRLKLCWKEGRFDLTGSDLIIKQGIVLDPKNVLIQSGGADPATGNTFGSDPSGDVTIDGLTLGIALDSSSVTIQANTDITVDDDIVATTSGSNLILQAGRNITISSSRSISLNAGAFSATVNDNGASPGDRDAGAAVFNMQPGSSISTSSGDITLDVGTFSALSGQMQILGATLAADGGNISITGVATSHPVKHGVIISDSDISTSNTGTLSVSGTGGSLFSASCGLDLKKTILSVEDGQLTLNGTGGGIVATGDTNNFGARIYGGTIESLGSGNISITCDGGLGADQNFGLMLTGGSVVSSTAADITLNGTGGGTSSTNFGIRLEGTSSISASGSGDVTMTGLGGGDGNTNIGVIISTTSAITSEDGKIDIQGTGAGSGDANHGIVCEESTAIASTGSGDIEFTGESSLLGSAFNLGVSLTGKSQVSLISGLLTVTGTSHGDGGFNQGVSLDNTSSISSTGTGAPGAVTITGTSGVGTNTGAQSCFGIRIGQKASISSVDADITLEGTSNAADTQGIDLPNPASVDSSGAGVVTITSLPI